MSTSKPEVWGMIWDESENKVAAFLRDDFNNFEVRDINFKTTAVHVSNDKPLTDQPRFAVKRIIQDKQEDHYFITSRDFDPKLLMQINRPPLSLKLPNSKSEFRFFHERLTLIIFKKACEMPEEAEGSIKIISKLGNGSFGSVMKGYSFLSDKIMAIKVLNKADDTKPDEYNDLLREIKTAILQTEKKFLLSVNHPNIVQAFKSESRLSKKIFCMELADQGDLHTYVAKQMITEKIVRIIARQLFAAVAFLHEKEFLHRDLKPENVLVFGMPKRPEIKLTDFGSICRTFDDDYRFEVQGTPDYLPPEVIKSIEWHLPVNYKKSTDVFSCGIVLYFTCYKRHAFRVIYNDSSFLRDLLTDSWTEEQLAPEFPAGSKELKDFLKLCLKANESERPSAEELHDHIWLKEV